MRKSIITLVVFSFMWLQGNVILLPLHCITIIFPFSTWISVSRILSPLGIINKNVKKIYPVWNYQAVSSREVKFSWTQNSNCLQWLPLLQSLLSLLPHLPTAPPHKKNSQSTQKCRRSVTKNKFMKLETSYLILILNKGIFFPEEMYTITKMHVVFLEIV